MDLKRLRRVLGDTGAEPQWSDADLADWIADADSEHNEYLLAADILTAHYNRLVVEGAGTSVRSDDITVNDYNNMVLLGERIKALRSQGREVSNAFYVSFPYNSY